MIASTSVSEHCRLEEGHARRWRSRRVPGRRGTTPLPKTKRKEGRGAGFPDAHPIGTLETRSPAATADDTQIAAHERKGGTWNERSEDAN
jgi:hypothetical protein